jgi:hypothetical protein
MHLEACESLDYSKIESNFLNEEFREKKTLN